MTNPSATAACPLPKENLVLLDDLVFYNKDLGKTSTCTYTVSADAPGMVDFRGYSFVEIQATELPTKVTTFIVPNGQLKKFPVLKATGLTQLYLSGNPIKSMDNVYLPDTLHVLNLASTGITDVEGATWPRDLTDIYMGSTGLTSFPKLAGLQLLSLDGTSIKSLDDVGIPSSLQYLYLSNTSITEVKGARFPSSLVKLDLSWNKLTSFPQLEADGIKELYLQNTPIASFPDSSLPESLTLLNMSSTSITQLKGVKLPPKMASLSLSNTPLASMSEVDAPSLTNLDLVNLTSPIDLKAFEFPSQPMTLNISRNPNMKFEGAKFPDRASMIMNYCKLESIDQIPFPVKMPMIELIGNTFKSFPQFPNRQTDIVSIDLSFNQITKLTNVSIPPYVTDIVLMNNSITDVRGVDFPKTLMSLNLANNPVKYFEISKSNFDAWFSAGGKFKLTLNLAMTSCENGAEPTKLISSGLPICVMPDDKWQALYPQTYQWIDKDLESSGSHSSNGGGSNQSSTGAIVGIVIGCVAVLVIIAGIVFWRRRQRASQQPKTGETPATDFNLMTDEGGNKTNVGALISDPDVFAAKIPLNRIKQHQLIGKGGCGEVYKGIYKDQEVAIKRLFPEHRKSMKHIEGLLAEVKLMCTMEHPNIVRFIGVAWDALTDLCIVVEFMGGGDLRGLLVQYEKTHRPHGLDHEKLRIAEEIANGLTYLHSLNPKVLHRDLKSGNVLLNENLEAKLTDFGISRETSTQTMTAGIGTSLWMAPEVMMGGHYDEKADIFSFGVVLSELDSHEYPYSLHKVDSSGRKVPEAALLQQVAMGTIRATFSTDNSPKVLALAYRCLNLDPTERPSAAEVAYELQLASKAKLYPCAEQNQKNRKKKK